MNGIEVTCVREPMLRLNLPPSAHAAGFRLLLGLPSVGQMDHVPDAESVIAAAKAIAGADALLITAAAGMGVDSGLPDFRGEHGFWNAYPAYRQLGLSFVNLANPRWFN